MAAIIYAAGHRLAFRAPYYPIDGPIEFVFNTVQGMLRINMAQITVGGLYPLWLLANNVRLTV
jgi:hypothetical protein